MPYIPPEVVEKARGIGGYSVLDYLIKVKPKEQKPKVLLLPKANRCATHAVEYLHGRGIDYDLIDFCISTGRLYVGGELDEGDEQPEKKAKEYER